jgi:hypothetical protein
MRRPHAPRAPIAAWTLLAACALLAGCGDDDGPASTAPPTPAVTVPAVTTATTPARSAPASDAQLVATARRHAEESLGIESDADEVRLLRSKRDPSWALAAGAGPNNLWAIWLRDGEVEVSATDAAGFDPPAVPCDVRPAFSEPSC